MTDPTTQPADHPYFAGSIADAIRYLARQYPGEMTIDCARAMDALADRAEGAPSTTWSEGEPPRDGTKQYIALAEWRSRREEFVVRRWCVVRWGNTCMNDKEPFWEWAVPGYSCGVRVLKWMELPELDWFGELWAERAASRAADTTPHRPAAGGKMSRRKRECHPAPGTRSIVWPTDGSPCRVCLGPMFRQHPLPKLRMTRDHILRKRSGARTFIYRGTRNIRFVCQSCNRLLDLMEQCPGAVACRLAIGAGAFRAQAATREAPGDE